MPYIEEAVSFENLIKIAQSFSSNLSKQKSSGIMGGALTKSSIMKATKDLVLSFPVLCSNTITPQTATMVTKAIERNCVTTLQLLIGANYLSGPDGIAVIKKLHNNMDENLSLDDYLDTVDAALTTAGDMKGMFEQAGKRLLEAFLAQQNDRLPLSSFSESAIDGFVVTENKAIAGEYSVRRSTINEAKGRNNSKTVTVVKTTIGQDGKYYDYFADEDIDQAQFDQNQEKIGLQRQQMEFNKQNAERQARENRQSRAAQNLRADRKYKQDKRFNQSKIDLEKNKVKIDQQNLALQQQKLANQKNVDRLNYFNKQLLDSDVKKANELVPSMIVIQYNVVSPELNNKDEVVEKSFIAGVKARLIPCDSMEIIDRIVSANKTKVSLVNLIRATTGEIKLAKDFIFAIDQAKIDAKTDTKLSKTSPIWRSLQSRSTRSGINRLSRSKANDAAAITTLVMTSEEVNLLKKEYNFDLNSVAKATSIMETYNLMCLVIVDEDIEVARFLFDGEKYYQDYSFNSLERETGDGSYKKVINLISKVNRG